MRLLKPVLVKGHWLRDEFACPITRELMRDPVIAADGHTYDREAMEMWLKGHDSSPRTGQPMEHLLLVPNLNLKRLIKDLISEGGEGLYMRDADQDSGPNAPYRFALVPEQMLTLKCLGPQESDWNGKSYGVTQRGCFGGRKQPLSSEREGKDFMHFTDPTVSRSHLEIIWKPQEKQYFVKDLGSAGGTFIRIPFGVPKPLMPGMMVMIGKHQMKIDPVNKDGTDDTADAESALADAPPKDGSGPGTPTSRKGVNSPVGYGMSRKLLEQLGTLSLANGGGDDMTVRAPTATGGSRRSGSRSPMPGDDDASVPETPMQAKQQDGEDAEDDGVTDDEEQAGAKTLVDVFRQEAKRARGHRQLKLHCFAPEGTPIQNKMFIVDTKGATLGRKQTNDIPFSHEVNGTIMGIDSSISGEHARITYSEADDCLQILDGTADKQPSTNGTWFRLSGMHKESDPYVLQSGSEILVGTVRFLATIETIVVEKEITSEADVALYRRQGAECK